MTVHQPALRSSSWVRHTSCVIVALGLLLGGCRDARDITAAEGEMAVVVDGNNQFAVDVYGVAAADEGNLFFSPFSIDIALSMLYAGAEGDTETQIADALYVEDEDAWHANLAALSNDLCGEHHRAYSLYSANAVWGQEDVPFLGDFVSLMDETYDAPLEEIDFIGDSGGAKEEINGWVEDETRGHIPELFEGNDINSYTRLVLANAIYFQADWDLAFDDEDTTDQEFTLPTGETVQVSTMVQTEEFGYTETDEVQLLEMPYEDDEISMVVVLPTDPLGLSDLEATLTSAQLDEWIGDATTTEVRVWLPSFEMDYELPLKETLETLGMTDMFEELGADFTGLVAQEDMEVNYYVSAARHKAYLKVDEQGTEAAAATGFAVSDLAAGPDQTPTFLADHPFLFLIRDQLTGAILFMGRIEDPRG